jgi:hypothetical protein
MADGPSPPYAVSVTPYSVSVEGQTATGWLAVPQGIAPTTLLVYAHGCCGYLTSPDSIPWGIAAAYGAIVVGMSYRGNGHWNVRTGAADTVAATLDVQARYPSVQRTIVWGISMGGETSGMAVAARPDIYDYWVDTFGVTDLFQEFGALGIYPGVAPNANDPANPIGSWILEETGGLPGVAPLDAWVSRSPDLLAAQGHMNGLKHAYLNHGVGDLIVYPTETAATYAALNAQQVPVSLCLAATRPGGIQQPFLPGVPQLPPTPVGLSAHDGYGFACSGYFLDALLRGQEPDAGEVASAYVVDFTTGAFERVAVPP